MGDAPDAEPETRSLAVTATPLAISIARPAAQQPVWLSLRQKVAVWGQAFGRQPLGRYAALGVLFGLVIIGGILFPRLPIPAPPDSTPTRSVIQVPLGASAGTPESSFPAIYPQAAAGETLLIVAPFRGYTPTERYNVAGRIRDALLEEIVAANLLSTTIAIWPEEIGSSAELGPVLAASDAALVIWGEYDSGRVRVNLDGQNSVTEKHDFPLSSPTELITTITSTLPKEIRMLALAVLGRLLRNQGDFAKATRTFEQAIRLQPGDPKTTARLYFYLGHMAEQTQTLTALARAQRYYDAALAANPLLIDARYNRGTVNLNRSYLLAVDDPQFRAALDAAIADLTDVITDRPGFLFAYQNRGVAHYERNGDGDQARAVADFSHIIAVDPENTRAYFHRALAQLRGDTGRSWVDDFEQSLLLTPDYYPATNGLCWGYALAEQPDVALPFCDEAVALDPTGASRDSRAIVYAQLGRYAEAVADFSAYLAWVEAMDSSTLYTRYRGPVVEEWIVQLDAGKNPFDSTLLNSLR